MKAVGFDLDGTLFDRNQALRVLLEKWLGASVAADALPEIRKVDGYGNAPRGDFFRLLAEYLPPEERELRRLARRFRHDFPGCIAPERAALEALAYLQAAGVPLALLSNGTPAFQIAKLRACGALPFFEKGRMLFSGALGFAKPDPRCFRALADCVGVDAGELLFIGDDPDRDLRGALAAGMQARMFWRNYRSDQDPREPLTIFSMQELMLLR